MTIEVLDTATGEVLDTPRDLVPFVAQTALDRTAQGVVSILAHARDWLASAVEMTGPAEIAAAKAQIVTAATYAKELQLSKEIQMDATEMVRRAEYALGKAIRKGQEEGTVATTLQLNRQAALAREAQRRGEQAVDIIHGLPRPSDFADHDEMYGNGTGIAHLAKVSPEEYDAAINAAKEEGNLSRANVVRKVNGIQPGETRDMRARKIEDLAGSGHSTRQIAPLVGIGEDAVADIIRDYGIDVPADAVVKRTKRIRSADVIDNVIGTVEAATFSLGHVSPSEIQGAQIDSLIQSISALLKAANKIKESLS